MPGQSDVPRNVGVIGGCGHVRLLLAIALADSNATVTVYDVTRRRPPTSAMASC